MKVPEPRKLDCGTWFIQMRLNGQSVPVTAPSKRECVKKAELIKAEYRSGKREVAQKTDKSIREVMSAYIDSIRVTASPATVRGYTSVMNTRFLSIADKPISKVKDWQGVIDAEAKIVSAKTVKNAWGLLATALRHADIKPPDVHMPRVVPADKEWLEPDEILRFIKLMEGDRFEIPALLALHGLRRSEIFALSYDSIDLKSNTIAVHGAAVLGEDGKLVQKKENKNASSRRIIPIMIPELAAAIERIPAEQRTGKIYDANATTLYWKINQVCEKNGLPKVGVHGLRHSFASLAYHLGLSEQETMELGGWSDYNTMRKIYTHLAMVDRLKGQNKMAAFFAAGANSDKNAN